MTENEMMSANGGYTYRCVCGETFVSKDNLVSDFYWAVQYNQHLKYCVEAQEAGIV